MAVITFMSDFGEEDHYIAAVKAAILRHCPTAQIIDISHKIAASDIGHAAYLLKHVFREFPSGSVHLCAIDRITREPSKQIALQLEGHFFVGPDSGLFSLISGEKPTQIVELAGGEYSMFPSKIYHGPAAGKLLSGVSLASLGPSLAEATKLFERRPKVTKREIAGHVVRVDSYGNLITNITQTDFETIRKITNQAPFEVIFGRETTQVLQRGYYEVESGDCFVLFNSSGNLEIGINKGNAAELLGLRLDSQIFIQFKI